MSFLPFILANPACEERIKRAYDDAARRVSEFCQQIERIHRESEFGFGIFPPGEDPEDIMAAYAELGSFAGAKMFYEHATGKTFGVRNTEGPACDRDTDGDGDCDFCHHHGGCQEKPNDCH